MSNSSTDGSLPWFVKAVIAVALLVVLFILGIDLLTFAAAW
ncbi:hypothetical protein [Haloarcula sediminis]|nr:hypothetical protein [Haloarcula sp. CK38]